MGNGNNGWTAPAKAPPVEAFMRRPYVLGRRDEGMNVPVGRGEETIRRDEGHGD